MADRREILRRYARGDELRQISEDLGINHEDTVEVVSSIGFTRSRAANELRTADAKPAKAVFQAPPAVPAAAPRPRVEVKPKPTEEKPVAFDAPPVPDIDVRVRPEFALDQVLVRADKAGGRFAARAKSVRTSIRKLADDMEARADVIAAEQTVSTLKAELEAAAARLRSLKKPVSQDDYDRKVVRDWAKANNIDVPARGGHLPPEVVAKWRELFLIPLVAARLAAGRLYRIVDNLWRADL